MSLRATTSAMLRASPPRAPPSSCSRSDGLGLVPPAELQEGPARHVQPLRCGGARRRAHHRPEYLDAAAALRAFEAAWDGRRANIPQQLSLGHRAVCAALEHCARAAATPQAKGARFSCSSCVARRARCRHSPAAPRRRASRARQASGRTRRVQRRRRGRRRGAGGGGGGRRVVAGPGRHAGLGGRRRRPPPTMATPRCARRARARDRSARASARVRAAGVRRGGGGGVGGAGGAIGAVHALRGALGCGAPSVRRRRPRRLRRPAERRRRRQQR